MIVLAETTFIFEIVLQQEEVAACHEILKLCAEHRATLVLPAFSIAEAGSAIERRRGKRRSFFGDLTGHLRDASRAAVLKRYSDSLTTLKEELTLAEIDEADNWTRFRMKKRTVKLIDLTAAVLDEAYWLELDGMKMPDAIVLASVVAYLKKLRKRDLVTPAIFVSRDEDFLRAKRQLKDLRCKFAISFRDAAEIIRRSSFASDT